MKAYTNHGKTVIVPDFRKQTIVDSKKQLKKSRLNFAIEDSTYTSALPPGTIIDQNPRPNSTVKKNRTVYFVVNSSTPPPVKMPNLVDNSYRQASLKLNNIGLKVGKKIYKPDIARDAVLQQLHNGKPIAPGARILKGQTIDLVLGDGFGNTTMKVPDLVGLTYNEAILALHDSGLRPGQVIKTETVKSLEQSMIFDQSPASGSGTLEMGQTVDLYLTDIPNE